MEEDTTNCGSSTTLTVQVEKESSRSTTPVATQHSPATMYSKPDGVPEEKPVDWNSSMNTHNPFNWPSAKKWRVTILACFMTFVIQINGTMMTSAAEQINESFHVSDEKFPHSYWPVLSWNLGGAAAPLFGLPLMENFGVRQSYMVCHIEQPYQVTILILNKAIHAVLIIFLIPQASAHNFATIIVTRIITGSCSGILANITSGIVSDIWKAGRPKSFGTSLYIWSLLAGLSMGPVFGSLAVQYTTWRWYVLALGSCKLSWLTFLQGFHCPNCLLQRSPAGHISLTSGSEAGGHNRPP
jgi:MFS family permease